jgi:hypothetical protein
VPETCLPYNGSSGASSCAKPSGCPSVPPGKFSYVQYSNVPELQQHIMTHGAVTTAFLMYQVGVGAACGRSVWAQQAL